MTKERVLVAHAAQVQIHTAIGLLRQALGNLHALQYGTTPSVNACTRCLTEAERAYKCVLQLLERIP